MHTGIESLVALYLAGLCGLGYGARQIVRAQQNKGIKIDTIVVSGGAAQSRLVRQVLADTTGLTVAASASPEPVLLGSAMLGSVASGSHPSVRSDRSLRVATERQPGDGGYVGLGRNPSTPGDVGRLE
jgi:D-ribulokinase